MTGTPQAAGNLTLIRLWQIKEIILQMEFYTKR
jgi:hypothetical protein